jgi:Flp pilus assembly protein CpaB
VRKPLLIIAAVVLTALAAAGVLLAPRGSNIADLVRSAAEVNVAGVPSSQVLCAYAISSKIASGE